MSIRRGTPIIEMDECVRSDLLETLNLVRQLSNHSDDPERVERALDRLADVLEKLIAVPYS